MFFGKLINSLGTYYDQPIILADKVNKVGNAGEITDPCRSSWIVEVVVGVL